MILKGTQRGGAGQLAAHLLNAIDNDHVTVQELRGFLASDLQGAFAEAHAVSKGTRCRQFLFSLSLNPPKDAEVGIETLLRAADRAEDALGLKGQPRAVIVHEKNGRRHAHVVWSRIDPNEMKAINLPHFKNRLSMLSKDLYLEHGWELPEGHKTNGWKNPLNFTLAEWQQAKRLDLDPREIKQVFQEAWAQSDNQASFRNALEERGYFLAQGDRRGFVAVDIQGEAYSVARWTGVRTKEMNAKLGRPDGLPTVQDTRAQIHARLSERLRGRLREHRQKQAEELKPQIVELRRMVQVQREERARLEAGLKERQRVETKMRASRLHSGIRGAWELLTGKARAIRRQNDAEAYQGYLRDRDQREALFDAQIKERRALQEPFDQTRSRQREERMLLSARMASVLRYTADPNKSRERQPRPRGRSHDLEMDM